MYKDLNNNKIRATLNRIIVQNYDVPIGVQACYVYDVPMHPSTRSLFSTR